MEEFDRSKLDEAPSSAAGAEAPVSDGDNEASQIRSGIEKTRASLSETIDALQDKLDPSRIAEQVKEQIREKATEAYDTAKSAVREATIGKAEKIMSSVSETVSDMTGRAGTAVGGASSSVVQYIRDNPVPFALLGLGAGMLALSKRQSKAATYVPYSAATDQQPSFAERAQGAASGVAESAKGAAATIADTARSAATRTSDALSSAATSVRGVAGSVADSTRQQFSEVSSQARQGVVVANDRIRSTMQENPMAMGIAALAAGALVGLTLPSTRIEGEYMGEARERLVDQAKTVAQEAAGKVQRVAEGAGHSLHDAAQKEGLLSS